MLFRSDQTTAGVSDPAAHTTGASGPPPTPNLGTSVPDSGTERSPPTTGQDQQLQSPRRQPSPEVQQPQQQDPQKKKELLKKEHRKLRQQTLPLQPTPSATPPTKDKQPAKDKQLASTQSPALAQPPTPASTELVPLTQKSQGTVRFPPMSTPMLK